MRDHGLLRRLQQGIEFILERNKNGPSHLTGIDISPEQVKCIQINYTKTPYEVQKYAIAPMPPGAFTKDSIQDIPAIAGIIKNLYKQNLMNNAEVALAIPRSLAIIKTISIDNRLTTSDIESRAWVEANRNFPDLVGEIYLDFVVLGSSANDSQQQELVLVACRKDQIKPYLEITKLAGLTAKVVDVDSYALARAFAAILPDSAKEDTVGLFNLDVNLSSLIVMNNDNLLHAHDQSYDGRRLLSQVKAYQAKEVSVSPSDPQLKDTLTPPADSLASRPPAMSLLNDPDYLKILNENLIAHLRHTINLFYSSRSNVTLSKIFLSGECAVVPDLTQFIQRELGIVTEIADPFAHMTFAADIDVAELKKQATKFMLSCGLALSAEKK